MPCNQTPRCPIWSLIDHSVGVLGAAICSAVSSARKASICSRAASICRELTKLHEEVRYENLDVLARLYASGAETRGEFVVLVAPPAEEQRADDIDALLKRALSRVSVKDAVGEVAVATGRPRREIYQRALALTKDDKNGARW